MPLYGGLIHGHVDNYVSYSSCKKKKAMKTYRCFVTGIVINKGDYYKELCCWNPHRGKNFTFKLHMSVTPETIRGLRCNPEHSEQYKKLLRLGFFTE